MLLNFPSPESINLKVVNDDREVQLVSCARVLLILPYLRLPVKVPFLLVSKFHCKLIINL